MFGVVLCLRVAVSFGCPLRKGLAGSAWTCCSLAGCTGSQQTLVPVQSSAGVAESSGCRADVLRVDYFF